MALLLNVEHPEQMDAVLYFFSQHKPVAVPSETVYGLAAPFDDEKALSEIFRLKARPSFNPLIVHVTSVNQAESIVEEIPVLAKQLMKEFWPGPLTVLLKKNFKVPDLCTGSSLWVGVRSPENPVFKKIIIKAAKPLAAPSANRYQGISPVCSRDVLEELGPFGLEAVVEGGQCVVGLESTVVRVLDNNELEILRLGAITVEALRDFCGDKAKITVINGKNTCGDAPGQAQKHYSPQTKALLYRKEESVEIDAQEDVLLKVLAKDAPEETDQLFQHIYTLSEKNCLLEASSKLFSTLRALDQKNFTRIFLLETTPNGLGRSINDRLLRATGS